MAWPPSLRRSIGCALSKSTWHLKKDWLQKKIKIIKGRISYPFHNIRTRRGSKRGPGQGEQGGTGAGTGAGTGGGRIFRANSKREKRRKRKKEKRKRKFQLEK